MRQLPLKKENGFTLMETVIYAGLLAVFLSATFLFVNNILSTTSDIVERNEITLNKEFLDQKFNWLLSQATDVTAPVAGSSGSSITITGPIVTIYPAVITLSDNRLYLSLAGGASSPITNNRVKITSFSASNIVTSSTLREIRIITSMTSKARSTIVSNSDIFAYVLP